MFNDNETMMINLDQSSLSSTSTSTTTTTLSPGQQQQNNNEHNINVVIRLVNFRQCSGFFHTHKN